jgi:hypothetical protein
VTKGLLDGVRRLSWPDIPFDGHGRRAVCSSVRRPYENEDLHSHNLSNQTYLPIYLPTYLPIYQPTTENQSDHTPIQCL